MADIRERLLKLPTKEIKERKKVKSDYYFYKGKCSDEDAAKNDKAFLGQSWEVNDNVDYEPTQDIRNKVKTLLKKQARFMFGTEPFIQLKPDNMVDNDKCEEFRKFIDDVLESNNFWNNTKKAFLMSTIKKRILLRIEANPGQPIIIKYENIEDFYYKEKNGKLLEVKFFQEDDNNVFVECDSDKIFYVHTYYYDKQDEKKELQAYYKKQSYKGSNIDNPIQEIIQPTGFSKIPCWLIKNGGELGDEFGETEIDDLRGMQTQYNRKNSDLADASRFGLFGAESVIDGDPNDVARFNIAPNAIHAVKTSEDALGKGKQAVHERLEYNLNGTEAVESYLDRIDKDMRDVLGMPSINDLNNIPSAKAMKYMYNDLIDMCEEKWNDWEPALRELIYFITEAAQYSYSSFNRGWLNLKYTLLFKHNYPLPADEEDKKKLAMLEVESDVRSKQSYIREFSDEEDAKVAFEEILIEKVKITNAETDQYNKGINKDLDDIDDETSNTGDL